MNILIVTGIYPPHIGGPSQYAYNLQESFVNLGYQVRVKTYRWERILPTGIRHIYFFFKIIPAFFWADFCIALDTFSVGFPSVVASQLCRKKVILRTGGDFLWEEYLDRTKKKVLLREFYKTEIPYFNKKEKIIFAVTKWTLKHSFAVVFSTKWQREIWNFPYTLSQTKNVIIENFYGPKLSSEFPTEKIFIASSRPIQFKNLDVLAAAFEQAKLTEPYLILDQNRYTHAEFLEHIKKSYAAILVSLGDISPNFIMDVIRFNKPFILTKENGIGDRLKDAAVLVDPLNEKEITQAIVWLSQEKNYEIQKKKVENFLFTHLWKEIAQEFIEIYENHD